MRQLGALKSEAMAITTPNLRAVPRRAAAHARLAAPPFWLWSLGAALLAAVALLWPLPARLQTHALDTGDGLHLAWTLRYAQLALLHPGGGFAAPAAFPYEAGLLLNPPLYAMALVTLPLYALGWNATAVYNAATLLSFALACWALALLGRRVTGSGTAGLVAGLVYAFADARLAHLAHLNLLSGFWTALLLVVLLAAWREPPRTWRGLAALALGSGLLAAAQALSDVYNAVYMVVAVGLLGGVWAAHIALCALRLGLAKLAQSAGDSGRKWPAASATRATKRAKEKHSAPLWANLRVAGALLVGALLASTLVAPVLAPTLAAWRELGVSRSWADHEALRAAPAHYAVAAFERPLYDLTDVGGRGVAVDPVEQRLWPGAAALALAAVGLVAGRGRRRERVFLGALAALAFALSLGPQVALGGHTIDLPWYRWLFEHAPLFAATRVPARWALLLQLALAGLAALGSARLLGLARIAGGRTRRLAGLALTVALLACVFADVRPGPTPMTRDVAGEPVPEVYKALAKLPPGALLEWPLENASPTLKHRQQHYTLFHGRPIVNAAASAPPPRLAAVHAYLRSFPGAGTTGFLHDLGVRYVVVSRWEIGDWSSLAPRLEAAPGLRLVATYEEGRHLLYEVLPSQSAAPTPLAVVAPGPDGPRLHLQVAAPLWLDAPARLYRGERETPARLLLRGGREVGFTLRLPPVLLPGAHAWELPAGAYEAEALIIAGRELPLSAAPVAGGTGERPWLAVAPLPARLSPGDGVPCLAFGSLPARPGLVLAAALVDEGWNVAAKADHFLDARPGQTRGAPEVLPCGLTLPADMAPGSYGLALGLYDPAAGAFVPVEGPGGARSDGLLLVGGQLLIGEGA